MLVSSYSRVWITRACGKDEKQVDCLCIPRRVSACAHVRRKHTYLLGGSVSNSSPEASQVTRGACSRSMVKANSSGHKPHSRVGNGMRMGLTMGIGMG